MNEGHIMPRSLHGASLLWISFTILTLLVWGNWQTHLELKTEVEIQVVEVMGVIA